LTDKVYFRAQSASQINSPAITQTPPVPETNSTCKNRKQPWPERAS